MDLTEFYRGRRILVTGASGFVGRRLCSRLQDLGAIVSGLDKNGRQPKDVKNLYQVRAAFDEAKPDTVFHLAAKTEVRASLVEPLDTYRTNVLGTLNVLEVCRERKIGGLVFASSDKAYGCHAQPILTEACDLLSNADMYSASKTAADELTQLYSIIYQMPITILRPANIYGPGQTNATTLITGTINRLMRGEKPVVHNTTMHAVREWIFIDDAVQAYLLAGTNRENLLRPAYNVGSRDRYSVLAVVQMLLKEFGRGEFDYDVESVTCPQIGDQGLDSWKFREKYKDWSTVPFADGLRRTVEWYMGVGK
jgi:nucleoside-diphosphate-sugar epimerase